jgi:hypothetical protein
MLIAVRSGVQAGDEGFDDEADPGFDDKFVEPSYSEASRLPD